MCPGAWALLDLALSFPRGSETQYRCAWLLALQLSLWGTFEPHPTDNKTTIEDLVVVVV